MNDVKKGAEKVLDGKAAVADFEFPSFLLNKYQPVQNLSKPLTKCMIHPSLSIITLLLPYPFFTGEFVHLLACF
jgi:hypothetical protein